MFEVNQIVTLKHPLGFAIDFGKIVFIDTAIDTGPEYSIAYLDDNYGFSSAGGGEHVFKELTKDRLAELLYG